MPYICKRHPHPTYSLGYWTAISTMCSLVLQALPACSHQIAGTLALSCLTFLHTPEFQHFQVSDLGKFGNLLHVILSFQRGQKLHLCSHSWCKPSPVISWPLTNLIGVESGLQAATKYNHVIQCSIPSKYAFSNLLIPGFLSTFHKEPQTSCNLFHHTRS